MAHPIKEILLEELETVTDALATTGTFALEGEEREAWTDRLKRVNRALQFLQGIVVLTQQERDTLLTLIEFHEGASGPNTEAPFNVQAAESARSKLES